jgi:hypothetical protein
MCTRGEYVALPNPLDLVYNCQFLQKYLLYPKDLLLDDIRSAKQDDIYGASNIVLPCPGR